MSSSPASCQILRRDVAGMGAAAQQVRRAHHHGNAPPMRRFGRLAGGGKFGQGHALVRGESDIGKRRVVMAREGYAPGPGEVHQAGRFTALSSVPFAIFHAVASRT